MLCNLQILHDSARGDNTVMQMLNAEAFQRLGFEMTEQLLTGRLLGKYPVFKFENAVTGTEETFEICLVFPIVKYLLGREVAQKFLHIVITSLACKELPRGYIEERNAARALTEVHCSKEIILFVVQYVIGHCHARRY